MVSGNGHTNGSGKPPNATQKGAFTPTLKQRAFLAAVPHAITVTKAAEIAGIDSKSHARWVRTVPGYADAYEAAKERAIIYMEDECDRRAFEGQRKIKFDSKGRPILDPDNPTKPDGSPNYYTEHVYDSQLAMFRLRGLAPMKYRERSETVLTGEVNIRLMARMEQAQRVFNELGERVTERELARSHRSAVKRNNRLARELFRDRKRRRVDEVRPPHED